MTYEKYKAQNSKSNILSKIDILGSFDFTTCLISLDSIESNDMKVLSNKELQSTEINFKYRKILPLAIHEYTHFIDSTSTVWGINHLKMMNEAYLSSDRINRDETLFYKAKKFHTHLSKIRYPKYYTTVSNLEKQYKWGAYSTVGVLFDSNGSVTDESIMFLKFTSVSREEIARSPISAVSILEASAMAQEVLTEFSLMSKLSKDDLAIEQKFYLDKIMSVIYNKELTEYSACVHMLANQQQCKDIIQAFFLVSIITRIVLNCTEEVFNKIIDNDKLTNTFDFPATEPFFKRLKDGLKYKNIGVLYYIIVFGLPDNSYLNQDNALSGLEKSLNNIGIDIDFIKESAIKHIEENSVKLLTSSLSSIVQLTKSAKKNFDTINIISPILEFDKLNLPKVILGDSSEVLIFNNQDNSLAQFDLDKCFNELVEGESWVNRFSEGCI